MATQPYTTSNRFEEYPLTTKPENDLVSQDSADLRRRIVLQGLGSAPLLALLAACSGRGDDAAGTTDAVSSS